ncbi:MAG: hypothetical protein ABI843_03005 [Dokdonella sp.]
MTKIHFALAMALYTLAVPVLACAASPPAPFTGVDHYALYVMDYGAPIGYRLALKNSQRVTAFVVQNGNEYDEGLGSFWDPVKAYWKTGASSEREVSRWLTTIRATRWQYTNGAKDVSMDDPDAWTVNQALMDRTGNADIQLDMLYDYRTNVTLYPGFQAFPRAQAADADRLG